MYSFVFLLIKIMLKELNLNDFKTCWDVYRGPLVGPWLKNTVLKYLISLKSSAGMQ